jgi:hypothetical protein
VAVLTVSPSSARHWGSGADRFAHRRDDLFAEHLQRVDEDLREGRERLDGVGQDLDRDVGMDRQRRLLQLTRPPPARARKRASTAPVAEERKEAIRFGIRARVGGGLRDTRDRDHRAEAARRRARRRGLRVGVGDSRNGLVVAFRGSPRMLAATTSPWYLPTCVSGHNPFTSPIAHRPSPRAGARRRRSRERPARHRPARARSRGPGAPPVATSNRSPRSSRPSSSSRR